MPIYHITIVNSDFAATEDIEAPGLDNARAQALRGALNIGTDEICKGQIFFGAQVNVQGDEGTPESLMVAIGTTPLSGEALTAS